MHSIQMTVRSSLNVEIKSSRIMNIGEASRRSGLPLKTIRYYEDQGLLSPERDGLNRVFSNRDRVRLKLALRAKRLGFTLNEIRELFELYDVSREEQHQLEVFLAKLERRRAMLEQQREDIEVMLEEIEFFAEQCQRLLKEQRAGNNG